MKASGSSALGPGGLLGPGNEGPGAGSRVERGEAGIRGLAAALGGEKKDSETEDEKEKEEPKDANKKKKKKRKANEEEDQEYGQGLQERIAKRSPPNIGASALRRKTKRIRKRRKERKEALAARAQIGQTRFFNWPPCQQAQRKSTVYTKRDRELWPT